jgi:hypothetical protein
MSHIVGSTNFINEKRKERGRKGEKGRKGKRKGEEKEEKKGRGKRERGSEKVNTKNGPQEYGKSTLTFTSNQRPAAYTWRRLTRAIVLRVVAPEAANTTPFCSCSMRGRGD